MVFLQLWLVPIIYVCDNDLDDDVADLYSSKMKERTFWDEEQKRLARQKRTEEYQRLLGTTNLPKLISGGILKVRNMNPQELLQQGGYTEKENKSWTRRFHKEYRYHAYILDEGRIEIHTDKYKINNGRSFHIASTYLVKEENIRLRKLMPPPPAQVLAISMKKRYKSEVLSIEKLREALAKIKEENERNT